MNDSLKQIVNIQNRCYAKKPPRRGKKKSIRGEKHQHQYHPHPPTAHSKVTFMATSLEAVESELKAQTLPGKMALISAFPILQGSIYSKKTF